jgi:hypothetical protein
MHLKMAGALRMLHTALRVMAAIRPKVSFDQVAASVPEIMDVSLYLGQTATDQCLIEKQIK